MYRRDGVYTLVYGHVLNPLKMYRFKVFVETFAEHIENEVKWFYPTCSQQPMTKLTHALK